MTFAATDTAERTWKEYAVVVGLRPEDFGRRIVVGGRLLRLSGLNLKARSFPVLATGDDGRTFKLTADQVKRALDPTRDSKLFAR